MKPSSSERAGLRKIIKLYKKSSKKALGGSGEKSPKNVPKKQKADFRFLLFLDFFFAVFPARRNSLKMYLPEAPGNRPNGVSWDKGPRRTPPLAICTIQFVSVLVIGAE